LVEPGYRVIAANGQPLEVTNQTAVGYGGRLYHTEVWARDRDKTKAEWDGRSWFRKALNMPPKGYWHSHTRVSFAQELTGNLIPWL
jgi:hypothetical protein